MSATAVAVHLNRRSLLRGATLAGAAAVTIAAWVRPAQAADWARVLDFGNDTQR